MPVDLPHGATVTAIWAFWRDLNPGLEARVALRAANYRELGDRNDPTDYIDIGWVTSSASPGGITSDVTRAIDNATVDRSRFNYYVDLRLPANVVVTSVVIQYDPPR